MHHVITSQNIIYVTVLTTAILLLLKIINSKLDHKWHQNSYSCILGISPRCGSLTVREKQKHSADQPVRTWLGQPLYSCPFAPSVGEMRKQSVITIVDNIISAVCPFLLSKESVACKETLFPMKLPMCVTAVALQLCDVCAPWRHPSLLTPVEALVIALLVTPTSQDMLATTPNDRMRCDISNTQHTFIGVYYARARAVGICV